MSGPTTITDRATPQTGEGLRWHVWVFWGALAALLVTATRADPDLWGHLRFGLDFLKTHQLPVLDPYSFTQDRPWVNHEWLSEALTALVFRAGGPAGIVFLKSAVAAAATATLLWRLRGAHVVVSTMIASLALVAALPLTITMRPQIWSLLGLVLLMVILDAEGPVTPRRLLAVAALFLAWANLHGGWITGAAVLGLYCGIRALSPPRQALGCVALFTVALAATLVNPYGITLWRFLAGTVRASRADITEWQPFSIHGPLLAWISVLVPVFATAWFALLRDRHVRDRTAKLAVACLLILAGLKVSRIGALAAPAVVVLLGREMSTRWGRSIRLPEINRAGMLVFAIPVVAAIATIQAPIRTTFRCLPIHDSWVPDRDSGAYLAGLHGRLWVAFDWGEYAIWHFGPALRVSIDGRRETIYSSDVIEWHRAFDRGEDWARQRFARAKVDYVWLRNDPVSVPDWLAANGYRIDVRTPKAFIAVRRDLPHLSAPAAPLPSCFP